MYGTFYGWYMKCQSDTQTLAVIPAIHGAGKKRICSVQIITENGTWSIPYPGSAFHRIGRGIAKDVSKDIVIGKNRFGKTGIRLSVNRPELSIKGRLIFGLLHPLKYDVMGPFFLIPFLECRHSVWSMQYSVSGTVYINEQKYTFWNALGYWEGDRGRSFPKAYVWTQCFFPEGSLMLSVADIPMAGFHFDGVICIVLWQGKEYRLATYLGARADRIQNGFIRIIQRDTVLEAKLYKADRPQGSRQQAGRQQVSGQPLRAPERGDMIRIIHESAACRASYRFRKGKQTLFAFTTDRASFEYEYPD